MKKILAKKATKNIKDAVAVPDKKGEIVGFSAILRKVSKPKKKSKASTKFKDEWHLLVKNAPNMIMIVNREGIIQYVNYTPPGFNTRKAIGKKIYDYMNPESRNAAIKTIRQAFQTGESGSYENIAPGPYGRDSWYETKVGVIKRGSQIIAATLFVTDITERRQVAEKLKESEEKWRSLAETAPVVILTINRKGIIKFLNRPVGKCTPKKTIGTSAYDYVAADQRDMMRGHIKRVFQTGQPDSYEILGTGPEGPNSSWYKTRLGPILNNGQVTAVTLVATDITEFKQMEKKLKQSKESLRAIIDSSPNAITVTDLNGKIIDCNQATLDMHGFSVKEELIGKDALILIAGKDRQMALENMRKTLREGNIKDVEYIFVTKDGREFPAELSASVIRDSSGKPVGFMAITKDITERKRVDRVKSEFVSLASHQLRTPLAIMSWYSEMLLNEKTGKLNVEQKKYLDVIYTTNQQLGRLVNVLLDVSRIEIGTLGINPRPTNLVDLANNALSELQPQIRNKKLKIEKNYDKEPPIINVDSNIMQIIFRNLLSNAVKYTPEGGRVKLLIKKQKSDVLIEISDSGYGIPRTQQSQIFSKFFRGDNIKEKAPDGNGLGLYIVRSVLEESGGKIWFESKENKGTTFHILIPLTGMKRKEGIRKLED